jgi:hypothetical protein
MGCFAARGPAPVAATISPVPGEDPGLSGEVVQDGTLHERLVHDDNADLVILYGGEERGDLSPCGCKGRPRGGLARASAHVRGVQGGSVPTLMVHAGAAFDDTQAFEGGLRPDIPVVNKWFVSGLQHLGVAALNATSVDLPGLVELGPLADGLPRVSANVRGPGIEPYRVVQVGDLKVGVTGVSALPAVMSVAPGTEIVPALRAARDVIAELTPQVDLVVLLSWRAPEVARTLAMGGDVDVVVDANGHVSRTPPMRIGDAVWVRSAMRTERLGELRLHLEDGSISTALDRMVDLGPGAPEDADATALVDAAANDVSRARAAVFGPLSVQSPQ